MAEYYRLGLSRSQAQGSATVNFAAPLSHHHFLDSHLVPTPLRYSVKAVTRREIPELSASSFELHRWLVSRPPPTKKLRDTTSAISCSQHNQSLRTPPSTDWVHTRMFAPKFGMYYVLAVMDGFTVNSRPVERRSKRLSRDA